MKKTTSILFLLKKNNSYGSYTASKYSGLSNATRILEAELEYSWKYDCDTEVCVDANEIDKYVTLHQPDYCIIEAIWVTPEKMKEIAKLHKDVVFIVRIHSKIPFLAMEGNAIDWLYEINKLSNCYIATNNKDTHNHFRALGLYNLYLPNIYKYITRGDYGVFERFFDNFNPHSFDLSKPIDIGCFGSIRPLKNQLIQAAAAIAFGNIYGAQVHFHINGGRIEQNGSPVLKNIRALFAHSNHKLIEHGWLEPDDFNELLKTMDVGMQVSYTESFNVVSADMIYNKVPVVVSKEIEWVSSLSKVDENDLFEMANRIYECLRFTKKIVRANIAALDRYNKESVKSWRIFRKFSPSDFLYGDDE